MENSRYALITGASAGIGAHFARELAKRGYIPILVARREERLKSLAEELQNNYGQECPIVVCDVSKHSECQRLMEATKAYPIEVFINNAGFGDCSPFVSGDLSKELAMIAVNVTAMHTLMKYMLLRMEKQSKGYILNVASSAGLLPAGPYMATYYATKAYVASLTQAVARELQEAGSKIYVGCLCPGPVETEFNQVANVEFSLKGISASYCAAYAVKQMFRKKKVIVPTVALKIATSMGRLLPRQWLVAISSGQQKKKLYRSEK